MMDLLYTVIEMGRKFRRTLDGYISFKKFVFLVLLLLLLLLYLGPSLFPWKKHNYGDEKADHASLCLATMLEKLQVKHHKDDLHIQHIPKLDQEKGFLPIIGNGYFWLSIFPSSSYLYLPGTRSMKVLLPYSPVLNTKIESSHITQALVTFYTSGLVEWYQCYQTMGQCVTITHTVLAHRTRIGLLLHEINIYNPLSIPVDVLISHPEVEKNRWPSMESTIKKLANTDKKFILVSGKVTSEDDNYKYAVVIGRLQLESSNRFEPRITSTLLQHTIIHHAPLNSWDDNEEYRSRIAELSALVEFDLSAALTTSSSDLRQEHTTVWNQLWLTGFHISPSLAPGALNGDTINATLYYVMSGARAPLHELDSGGASSSLQNQLNSPLQQPTSKLSSIELLQLWRNLFYTENCYQGIPTLLSRTLWSHLSSMKEIHRVVSLWRLTLAKNGCAKLLEAGADGIIQAMVLSVGAFKFSDHHLEFNTEPKDLHRNCHFRRLSYGNETHLNISVRVRDEDNKAILSVALDRSDRDYYACDAGCIDDPLHLGKVSTELPVKVTNPKTAILYISADRQHIDDIRHIIHVQEVNIAPPHDHQILALHRHGHHLGGLPTMFWVSIACLVIIFHLFLFKLIYQEYCVGTISLRQTTRYQM